MTAVRALSPGSGGIREQERRVLGAVDTSAALLRTIAKVLDIRSVFPRVSEIVKHALPHDALELLFYDRAGRGTLEAVSFMESLT
jgi:hypothetical protein